MSDFVRRSFMSKNRKVQLAGWGDYVTSTISVTLVLFILGLVGVINITFDGIDRQVKEKMGFTVVLTDSIAPSDVEALRTTCNNAPYISDYRYLSADDVMAEEMQGDGADLVELLGVNPYAPMLEVHLKAEYANVDSVAKISKQWEANPNVAEVTANTEMIGNLNRNANLVNMILVIMAAALLLISFVLINNTVRLTVYARRFLIHTMKLVGAKGSFIRRPFLTRNALQGVIAGVLASALLASLITWSYTLNMGIETLLPWSALAWVFGSLLLLGVMICVIAAAIATNRYLRKSYDDMFN